MGFRFSPRQKRCPARRCRLWSCCLCFSLISLMTSWACQRQNQMENAWGRRPCCKRKTPALNRHEKRDTSAEPRTQNATCLWSLQGWEMSSSLVSGTFYEVLKHRWEHEVLKEKSQSPMLLSSWSTRNLHVNSVLQAGLLTFYSFSRRNEKLSTVPPLRRSFLQAANDGTTTRLLS